MRDLPGPPPQQRCPRDIKFWRVRLVIQSHVDPERDGGFGMCGL
jgi:hypothetical protein